MAVVLLSHFPQKRETSRPHPPVSLITFFNALTVPYQALLPFFCSKVSRSAIMAMNSLFVGFPLALETVYPKYFWSVSKSPRSQATSMAWRMARSTREGVVAYRFATSGYKTFVTALMTSISFTVIMMASRKYW